MLIDVASKGGNFLLNVGPTAEGVFPPESVERLADIGRLDADERRGHLRHVGQPHSRRSRGAASRSAALEAATRLYLHVFDYPG